VIRYIREELLIVLGTSSSESVLPRMLIKMERLGAKKSVVGLVIPTGYSFNLDGTAIYLTMAAVFIAQATDTHMDITHQITLLVVLLLSSKGAAGVTGSGFIVLAATLSAVGHLPVAGLALILGIDRFMSEARALTNLVGNAVATWWWPSGSRNWTPTCCTPSWLRAVAALPMNLRTMFWATSKGQPRLTPSKPCHDEKPASAGFFARDLSTRVTVTGTLGDCP
jgi:hypothetical protein